MGKRKSTVREMTRILREGAKPRGKEDQDQKQETRAQQRHMSRGRAGSSALIILETEKLGT